MALNAQNSVCSKMRAYLLFCIKIAGQIFYIHWSLIEWSMRFHFSLCCCIVPSDSSSRLRMKANDGQSNIIGLVTIHLVFIVLFTRNSPVSPCTLRHKGLLLILVLFLLLVTTLPSVLTLHPAQTSTPPRRLGPLQVWPKFRPCEALAADDGSLLRGTMFAPHSLSPVIK